MKDPLTIETVAELLAHAHAMESEAYDRYLDLAEQMEVHNNAEVAELFRKMANVELAHVQKILERIGDMALPRLSPWEYSWLGQDSPESATAADAHYMMTPYHALQLALRAEQQAQAFYAQVVSTSRDDAVRELARELADEEREHVELVQAWLTRYPKPEADWDDDLDPPTLPD